MKCVVWVLFGSLISVQILVLILSFDRVKPISFQRKKKRPARARACTGLPIRGHASVELVQNKIPSLYFAVTNLAHLLMVLD